MATEMGTTKTIPEMRDIIYKEMKEHYDRSEEADDIREVLRLQRATEQECERREIDARNIICGERVAPCPSKSRPHQHKTAAATIRVRM